MPKKEEKKLDKEAKKLAKETKKTAKAVATAATTTMAAKKPNERPVYIPCPRCELNDIVKGEEKYCIVCRAALGLADKSVLIVEDESMGGEKLCPICSVTYIAEDEKLCFICLKDKEQKELAAEWEPDSVVEAPEEPQEEEEETPIVLLDGEDDDEDEEEDEDFSSLYKEPDDIDYTVDENDFLETSNIDDEDDEDDEEEF